MQALFQNLFKSGINFEETLGHSGKVSVTRTKNLICFT